MLNVEAFAHVQLEGPIRIDLPIDEGRQRPEVRNEAVKGLLVLLWGG